MTTTSGDGLTTMPRRRLLALAFGTTAGAAAALVARPAGAMGSLLTRDDPRASRPDVVGDWFDQVVASLPPSPMVGAGVADRIVTIPWLSALGALAGHGAGAGHRFEDAAVATAVHHVLVALAPEQADRLDAALAGSLGAIREGDAKAAGIQAGRAAAARTLADREGDGLDPTSLNAPYTPPPEAPGVYRLPPGATATQGAGWSQARPFLLDRADRFRPGPPPALGTERYRRALGELHELGGAVSGRTEEQSDIAWLAPQMQYMPALRAIVAEPGRPLGWKVRLLAAYGAATADAQIATVDAKFTYLHWRPVTAIREAGTDGDPRTDPDPTWTSYLPTPPNPDYPSAHAVIAGAAERVLERFTGPRTPVPFTASYARGDGHAVSRTYPRGTRWSALTRENVDARVWAGVHFRFSDEIGAEVGRRIGDHDARRIGPSR
jgi:hypothetical protein